MIKLHESIKACSLEVSELDKNRKDQVQRKSSERNACLHTNYTMQLISLNQTIDRSRNSCNEDGWLNPSRVAATYTQH